MTWQTDDVGIFESPLSNEYWLSMEHFSLTRPDLVALSRSAVDRIFGGATQRDRLNRLLDEFVSSTSLSSRATPLFGHSTAPSEHGEQEVVASDTYLPTPIEPPTTEIHAVPADTARHNHRAVMGIDRITTSNVEMSSHKRSDSFCGPTDNEQKTAAEAAFISPISPTEKHGHQRKRSAEQARLDDIVSEKGG